MTRYQAIMGQMVTCVVTFEAPEDATKDQLLEAAYMADMPKLCHSCSGSGNKSLNMDGEWDVAVGIDGEAEIFKA